MATSAFTSPRPTRANAISHDGFWLAGRATVRIHTGTGRDSNSNVYQDRHGYVWDNRSDTATLSNDRGRVIDTDSWGDHNHRAGGHHDR